MGSAAGEVLDGRRHVRRFPGVQPARRPERAGQPQGLVLHIHRHDLRTRGDGDHHGGQADPAATVHRHPLAGRHAALVHHRPERRGDDSKTRRRDKPQVLRQPHEVEVGAWQRHEFGEGTPGREARLELVVANLRVAGPGRPDSVRSPPRTGQ